MRVAHQFATMHLQKTVDHWSTTPSVSCIATSLFWLLKNNLQLLTYARRENSLRTDCYRHLSFRPFWIADNQATLRILYPASSRSVHSQVRKVERDPDLIRHQALKQMQHPRQSHIQLARLTSDHFDSSKIAFQALHGLCDISTIQPAELTTDESRAIVWVQFQSKHHD